MTRILQKIQSSDDVSKLNTNFDRIAADLTDRSSTRSSTASGSLTLAANTSYAIEVSVIDSAGIYEQNFLPLTPPRMDMYIDNDGDNTYLYPLGSNIYNVSTGALTGAGAVVSYEVVMFRTVINQSNNEKATFSIIFRNTDASPHTVYFDIDVFYLASPEISASQRAA